jgi:uncharacterized protein YraI
MTMRRIALLAALCLLAGACGGDDAASTTSTTAPLLTSTTAPHTTTSAATTTLGSTSSSSTAGETSTTGTTFAWATFDVPAADLCVIEHLSGETLNVRSGPGTAYAVVGSLSFDQTGVHATGVGADDGDGQTWKEIDYFGGKAWVASWLLTANPCDLASPSDYCVTGTSCLERLNVRTGPGVAFQKLGSLPFDMVGLQATGASSTDADGKAWIQIRFRGGVGWAASWLLAAAPCSPATGSPCSLPSGGPSAGCVNGWTTPIPGSASWIDALEQIGVGGPWSEIEPGGFVVEQMRYCVGPEDADIIAPRPDVERWYIVGYAETDPSFRGRWLIRRTGVGFGLVAVASYSSTGFGSGVWETCPDGCRIGRPLAGELCDTTCAEDYLAPPCSGIAPGTWSPGDCSGLPPEVLACLG